MLGLTIAAASLAACDGPAAYANGLVQVANLSQTDASFHWQSPGLLGTPLLGGSGTEPIRACGTYARGFGPGDQQVTITSASDTASFVLAAPSDGQTVVWYVIGPDGSIRETTAAAAPASPYCAP